MSRANEPTSAAGALALSGYFFAPPSSPRRAMPMPLVTGWYFFRSHRYFLIAFFGYLIHLVLLNSFVLAGKSFRDVGAPSIPIFFAFLYLIGIFVYPQADLVDAASGFPRHFLTLPKRTEIGRAHV